MKIYTKSGDKGTTRLVDGSCVEKHNPHVEAYGTVDELNSYLGLIRSLLKEASLDLLDNKLFIIQNELFNIGSLLATTELQVKDKLPPISENSILNLEIEIDKMTQELPELKNFILPTGHLISSHCHMARTICRRAERRCAEAHSFLKSTHLQDELILKYLNRLSDYLFVLARFINLNFKIEDVTWKKI